MLALTATNSATLSMQASVTKSRLEQAKREAAQAEQTAETLRAQAQEQDHVAERARQRERTLNANTTTAANSPTSAGLTAPLSSAPKTAGQPGASYVETLQTELAGPQSPAQANYSFVQQKNLAISSLFQSANQVWQATPPDTRVPKLYAGQGAASVVLPAGSLLNAKA